MAAKKKVDPLALAFLVQGQLSAMNIALQSVVLAIPERRALIEEFFEQEIDDLIFGLVQEFPEPVSVGAELWAENFSTFLEAGEDATPGEPPDPANDPKA